MPATHVKILDKEAVSNMPYFGTFNRMFFHFYNHEAACESLHDLNFRGQFLTTCSLYIAMHRHSTLPSFPIF